MAPQVGSMDFQASVWPLVVKSGTVNQNPDRQLRSETSNASMHVWALLQMQFDACPMYRCSTVHVRLDAFYYNLDCQLLTARTSTANVYICRAVQRFDACCYTQFVAYVKARIEEAVQSIRVQISSSTLKPVMRACMCEHQSR